MFETRRVIDLRNNATGGNGGGGVSEARVQQLISQACGGTAEWGAITGTLSAQTDLQTALDTKLNKISNEDFEITDANKGVILKSANGTKYKITVDNDGSLTTTAI